MGRRGVLIVEEKRFRGVHAHKDGGFVAYIGHHGRKEYLGWFRDCRDAQQARIDAEVRIFGDVFDRRVPELKDGIGRIPLHGRGGRFYGWSLVSEVDFDRVKRVAWTIDTNGYVVGRPPGSKRAVALHRFILEKSGENARLYADHINRNSLDNRRSNLRLCSPSENARNTKLASNNTSGAKGVTRTAAGTWRARIWKDRKEIHIGAFATFEEARAAYDEEARRLHGDFASPNSVIVDRASLEAA